MKTSFARTKQKRRKYQSLRLSPDEFAEWEKLERAVDESTSEEDYNKACSDVAAFEISHNIDSLAYPHLFS